MEIKIICKDDLQKAEEIGAISFEMSAKVNFMLGSIAFYKLRMEAFQEWQKELPEPYRTECCTIIANGQPRQDMSPINQRR